MKYKVNTNSCGFFPQINIDNDNDYIGSDRDIAKILRLEYEEYINFII